MKRRPAETAGVGGGLAVAVALLLGLDDPEVLAAAAVLIGAVPAVVTLLVANGGARGVLRTLWRGRA